MTIKNASLNEFLLTEFAKYNIYTRKYVFILKFDIEKKKDKLFQFFFFINSFNLIHILVD